MAVAKLRFNSRDALPAERRQRKCSPGLRMAFACPMLGKPRCGAKRYEDTPGMGALGFFDFCAIGLGFAVGCALPPRRGLLRALGYGDPVWSRVQVREGQIKITPDDLA